MSREALGLDREPRFQTHSDLLFSLRFDSKEASKHQTLVQNPTQPELGYPLGCAAWSTWNLGPIRLSDEIA